MNLRRGFTLLEVVVVIVITGAMFAAITVMYVQYGRLSGRQKAEIDVSLDGMRVLDAVHDAALQADHVMTTHTFNGVPYTSGTTTAVFELPVLKSDGTIQVGYYDYLAISTTSANAYLITDAASSSKRTSGTKQLASTLSRLSFTYSTTTFSSVTNLYIDATTSESSISGSESAHLRGHYYLRNQ